MTVRWQQVARGFVLVGNAPPLRVTWSKPAWYLTCPEIGLAPRRLASARGHEAKHEAVFVAAAAMAAAGVCTVMAEVSDDGPVGRDDGSRWSVSGETRLGLGDEP